MRLLQACPCVCICRMPRAAAATTTAGVQRLGYHRHRHRATARLLLPLPPCNGLAASATATMQRLGCHCDGFLHVPIKQETPIYPAHRITVGDAPYQSSTGRHGAPLSHTHLYARGFALLRR